MLTSGSGQNEMCMMRPGMLSRRAGSRAALLADQPVCCSSATLNRATSFAALATAMLALSGLKAAAVTAFPSCTLAAEGQEAVLPPTDFLPPLGCCLPTALPSWGGQAAADLA